MRALIIAAGRGSRLHPLTPDMPKSLLQISGRSLIEHILSQLQEVGIKESIVVTGFKGEEIQRQVGSEGPQGMRVVYHENPEWEMKNGVSVLSAEAILRNDPEFLLLMSDHLFQSSLAARVASAHIRPNETVLGVDRRTQAVFDIDDATKVLTEGPLIRRIHKELSDYNGIDCGVFKCTPSIFAVLNDCRVDGDCSLTDACQAIAKKDLLMAEDIGDSMWIDVDTPEAFSYAEQHIETLLR
ncbi:MAG: sugar phosphate nucleotidyltransferase [Ignavibacteria bacterium]|nr:sugar phosphate nucleotidyltransferase [Ignavibacteria bacterium]